MNTPQRLAAACVSTGIVAVTVVSGGAASAGVSGPAFFVDHQLYRTVATPTDLSGTGAPAHAWDLIYDLGGAQMNVATAAPGDAGYNGGRWQVHALSFPSGYPAALTAGDLDHDGVLDSAAEILQAISSGAAVDTGVVKQFECPAIPLAHGMR